MTEIDLISAVKLVRRFTGLGLKEAKDLVEGAAVYLPTTKDEGPYSYQTTIKLGSVTLFMTRKLYAEKVLEAIAAHPLFPKPETVATEAEYDDLSIRWIRKNPVRALRIASDEISERETRPF